MRVFCYDTSLKNAKHMTQQGVKPSGIRRNVVRRIIPTFRSTKKLVSFETSGTTRVKSQKIDSSASPLSESRIPQDENILGSDSTVALRSILLINESSLLQLRYLLWESADNTLHTPHLDMSAN